MRRLNACHSLLQCVLKFFNMLLALVGAAMILYALWMLNQWLHTHPSAEAPAPNGFPSMVLDLGGVGSEAMKEGRLWETDQIAGISAGFQIALGSLKLPAPWFIYCFLGIGIAVCLITCFGRIAIETNNGCCLSSVSSRMPGLFSNLTFPCVLRFKVLEALRFCTVAGQDRNETHLYELVSSLH
eukprot:c23486_g3_i2 orf=363-914(+)